MNILEIAVVILIAVFAIAGWRKGFVRKLASMLSFVISIILVAVFLPYMTEFLTYASTGILLASFSKFTIDAAFAKKVGG